MNPLVVVLSSQLLYYLLIAQTGVVGAFDSQISELYTLPIGGVVGTLFSGYWRHVGVKKELYGLFGVQALISSIYPDYTLATLFVLGFVVGYTTPILLYAFNAQSRVQLSLGLAVSYVLGTALYGYPFEGRGWIALVLPIVSAGALYFSTVEPVAEKRAEPPLAQRLNWYLVGVMMLWIFLDSALFETLSRSGNMDIWNRHTFLIIASHLVGVYMAYRSDGEMLNNSGMIGALFAVSYLCYWFEWPLLLSAVYPIVISYYNVLLFRALIRMGDIRRIALAMVGVGWIASTAANGIALEHQLWITTLVFGAFVALSPIYFRRMV